MIFKNKTIFTIKGLNQERGLGEISKKITIFNLSKEQNDISKFEVDYRDRKLAKKLLEEHGFQIISYSSHGILFKFKSLLFRYGIIGGICFAVIFYLLQYNFILQINVLGQPGELKSSILTFVNENLNSRLKFKIDTESMEDKIKEEFKEVSSVSIAIVGQSLIINYNPSTLPQELEGDFSPIVSNYDAMITEINLTSGTLNVRVGDIVQKGDVLVFPYIMDSDGVRHEVIAKATITAQVWTSVNINHYDYRLETRRTGNMAIDQQVKLNDLVIYSIKDNKNFLEYEIEKKSSMLSKNLLLPLMVEQTIYYETVTEEIVEPFEEFKEEIIQKAREKTLIFLDKNAIIIEENYIVKDAGNIHSIEYTITTSQSIGG